MVSLYSPGIRDNVNEPIEGGVRLMKMLFLLSQEMRGKLPNFYKFEPYLYGPYSLDLYRDIGKLTKARLVSWRSQGRWSSYKLTQRIVTTIPGDGRATVWRSYKLTWKGFKIAERTYRQLPPPVKKKLRETKRIVNGRSFLSLLKYVYGKYPEFAKNSIITVP